MDIIDALCHRTCVHQLYVSAVEIAVEECFPDLHGREVDSKIQKFIITRLCLHDDQSSSYCLGKFLSLLPHLTHLEIDSCSLHDDFYKEISDQASLSQIQKFIITRLRLHDDQSSSSFLRKFLSLLPHLTHLEIDSCSLNDDFYKEIADQASLSQIQKFIISSLRLHDDQSSSYCLGKFLSLLSHLTDLEIYYCTLHDDFYKEIADQASSSQIQKCIIYDLYLRENQSSSYCLGKFLSLLSHLTDLKIYYCTLHDDLYKEIADQASSSQIQTVNLDFMQKVNMPSKVLSHSASKQLAKFLCSLPCLTTFTISGNQYLHDDFFTELASLAASAQNPYFREKKHISMLQKWSVRKQQQQQLNQCERPMTSSHQQPYLPHRVRLLKSAPPSGQFQSSHHRGIQSEPQQVLESPREGRHHSLHPNSGEASRYSVGQGSGYSSGVHTGLTSFPLSSQTLNLDMPSTSGSRPIQHRQGAAPVESERIPEHRKRIHSDKAKDDGDRVDERLEQRPRKRRAKTDRQPTSP